jgi:ATP adenylyltransferase
MADRAFLLAPGALWPAIRRQSHCAIESGALRAIDTTQAFVTHKGVRFLVRVAENLGRKDGVKRNTLGSVTTGKDFDPFLPPEEDLYVADISGTHLAVLNKFNVIENHLLIVTRAFEHQESLLTLEDFEALWFCMTEFQGLGFYNGGAVAGASQSHKHLQMVPLPLTHDGPEVPLEPLLQSSSGFHEVVRLPALTFRHAFARLPTTTTSNPLAAASNAKALYEEMLAVLGITAKKSNGKLRQSAPYNLLVARRWMLLIPRSSESYKGISINALGFAGSLFVRDRTQRATVVNEGPMNVLKRVA